jgi:hypothetical protein
MRSKLLSFVVCGLAVAISLALPMRAEGEGAAAISVSPSAKTVNYVDGAFQVEIMASNTSDLGAFGFTIKFNPSILKFAGATPGPLLSSTGRSQACPPAIDFGGQVQYGCFTNGFSPRGANGDGKLATLTFEPIAHGSTSMELVNPQLSDVLAGPDTTSGVGGSITVNGGPDPAPFVPPPGGSPSNTGGTNPGANSGSGSDPSDPTGPAGYLTSGPGGEPGSGAIQLSGELSSGVSGTGTGQPAQGADGAQAASGGGAGGFGRFGFGPEERSSDGPWPFVAALLALAGGGFMLAGAARCLRL